MSNRDEHDRRRFLKLAALSGVGLGLTGPLACGGEKNRAEVPGKPEAPAAEGETAAGGAEQAAKVPRRPLGSTGATVPILLLGAAQKFDARYDPILHRAFQEGVDHLDTALSYAGGQSHRTIAPFVKQVGDRKKVWITTKAGNGTPDEGAFLEGLGKCLKTLETDYVDLFFMHGIDDPAFLEPAMLKMGDRMRAGGKTRFFGFSSHGKNVVPLMEKAAKVGGIDAILFTYSFARYGDAALNRAIDACHKAGIGLIAMKTMNSVPDDLEKVVEFRSKAFSLPQAKLKAVWADERIAAITSQMDNTRKLAENVAAAKSAQQLTMTEFHQLQRLAAATAPYSCQRCSHLCEPCIDAPVNVADQLRYLMYHECYGLKDRARESYRRLPREQRRIAGVDFTRASAACPQGIDIGERLARARRVLDRSA